MLRFLLLDAPRLLYCSRFHYDSPVILSGNKLLAVDTDLTLRIFEWQNKEPYILTGSNEVRYACAC